ncbi:flagellar assembly protein FliW [Opitutus sp. ER46]|uniref:flagellar assembly protein FliW n=1 Tax=Opitutus sp. ER46 TaxID=2161864 RepID=UPI000D30ED37|nr:flagellar assembly protein FliW [Opitutus sp. ER46]PTX90929.1 flagellar assembly protein FliW [Opitutus sp. ER46]
MKVLPEVFPTDIDVPPSNELQLPQGIVGFGTYKRAELLYLPNHLPFLWMKLHSPTDHLFFIVIEPGGIVPGYEPEIFDEDAEQLGIVDPSQAMILNIVTLRKQNPVEATVNLIGPIVVNRRTRIGRQLVISNYSRYSAHHALVENPQASTVARSL